MVAALTVVTGCGFQVIGASSTSDDVGPSDASPDADLPSDANVDTPMSSRVTQGLIALYTFEEGTGVVVADRSGADPSVDLIVADPTRIQWAAGTLAITQPTIVASAEAANKILAGCRDADALTLEAWITPGVPDATTLGRIATLSSSNSSLAVTLMSLASHFEFRMDGPMTDSNGLPSLNTGTDTLVMGTRRHVVAVSAPSGERYIYLDGVLVATDARGGDLSGWGSTGHRFAVGNELDGNRAWLGTYDLVAVYTRALSQAEVEQNFAAGPQ